jgi:hypothetical protein
MGSFILIGMIFLAVTCGRAQAGNSYALVLSISLICFALSGALLWFAFNATPENINTVWPAKFASWGL